MLDPNIKKTETLKADNNKNQVVISKMRRVSNICQNLEADLRRAISCTSEIIVSKEAIDKGVFEAALKKCQEIRNTSTAILNDCTKRISINNEEISSIRHSNIDRINTRTNVEK